MNFYYLQAAATKGDTKAIEDNKDIFDALTAIQKLELGRIAIKNDHLGVLTLIAKSTSKRKVKSHLLRSLLSDACGQGKDTFARELLKYFEEPSDTEGLFGDAVKNERVSIVKTLLPLQSQRNIFACLCFTISSKNAAEKSIQDIFEMLYKKIPTKILREKWDHNTKLLTSLGLSSPARWAVIENRLKIDEDKEALLSALKNTTKEKPPQKNSHATKKKL